jgi:alpha-1,3-glucan synthase
MLSQLTKTVKMALKSSEKERAILRARSAVQRFPVVEWRQRMEDFHKRSISNSRSIAGANAWRESDCNSNPLRPMADIDDWNPVSLTDSTQPEWDAQTINDDPQIHISPRSGQWDHEVSATGDPSQAHLYDSTTHYSHDSDEYFAQEPGNTTNNRGDYDGFLDRANETIANRQRHIPDPFLNSGGGTAHSRHFSRHSRFSSVESISSIVEENSDSHLHKAIASV